jgi:hypothetical protein
MVFYIPVRQVAIQKESLKIEFGETLYLYTRTMCLLLGSLDYIADEEEVGEE